MHAHGIVLTIVFIVALTVGCSSRSTTTTSPSPGPSDSIGSAGHPASGSCDDTKARWAIGQRASRDLLERARNAAQAKIARFIRPNQPITMEFSSERLNLGLDRRDVVTSVSCG